MKNEHNITVCFIRDDGKREPIPLSDDASVPEAERLAEYILRGGLGLYTLAEITVAGEVVETMGISERTEVESSHI